MNWTNTPSIKFTFTRIIGADVAFEASTSSRLFTRWDAVTLYTARVAGGTKPNPVGIDSNTGSIKAVEL